MVFLKEYFEKVDFEKNQQTTKRASKCTQDAKSYRVMVAEELSHNVSPVCDSLLEKSSEKNKQEKSHRNLSSAQFTKDEER